MASRSAVPEQRVCPIDGTQFEVGGRGRPPRRQVYCSRHCMGVATVGHLPAERGSSAPRPRKNRDTLHNEAWLRGKYVDEGLNANEIARLLGCSGPSVIWALDKFGIERKSVSEAKRGRPSATVWTPEMRESLAVQRRGAANPFHGMGSERRGPNYHPDARLARVRAVRAYRRGVNGVDYDAMLAAQGGVCAICGRAEMRVSKHGTPFTLPVDHDHATGKVRGLLCSNCNAALGLVGDSIDTLRGMIAYLERAQT